VWLLEYDVAIPPPALQKWHFHVLQHVVNGPEGCPNVGTTFGNKDIETPSKATSLQHDVNGPEGSLNIERTLGNKDTEMQYKVVKTRMSVC
jgi:hypothetical protein